VSVEVADRVPVDLADSIGSTHIIPWSISTYSMAMTGSSSR
jgi:hypothetical protein